MKAVTFRVLLEIRKQNYEFNFQFEVSSTATMSEDCLNLVCSHDYTASFKTKAVVLYFYFHLEKYIPFTVVFSEFCYFNSIQLTVLTSVTH